MKKIGILLALAIAVSLSGCGKNDNLTDIKSSSEITSSDSVSSDIISSDNLGESSSNLSTTPNSSKPNSPAPKVPSKNTQSTKEQTSKASTNPSSTKVIPSKQVLPKASQSVPQEPTESTQFSASAIEQKLLVLVNEERGRLGLSSLTWSNTLYKSAKIRSDEIADANVDLGISHTRPNGTTWSTTLDQVSYSKYYQYAGENLAAVQQNMNSSGGKNNDELAALIFDGWKNSKGHYEAIIRPDTKEIGIAVSRNKTNVYATQHFGQID